MPANQESQHGQAFVRLPMGYRRHDSTLNALGVSGCATNRPASGHRGIAHPLAT